MTTELESLNTEGVVTGRVSGRTLHLSNRVSSPASAVPTAAAPVDCDGFPPNTQQGAGWTGILVVKGSLDISPLYKPAVDTSREHSVVYGDTSTGSVDFKMFDSTASRDSVIAHIATSLPIKPYALLIAGDTPKSMNVPVRNTTMSLWTQGHSTPGFNAMIDSVAQLNRTPIDEGANYTELMRAKVFEPQSGKYAVCLGYFSRHPRIVLATKNMELYAWVVFYNGVYAFVFSTNRQYIEMVKQGLETARRNDVFALPVELPANHVTVVHPLYWVTKFNKVFNSIKSSGSRLMITTYLREYILRNTIPLLADQHKSNENTTKTSG